VFRHSARVFDDKQIQSNDETSNDKKFLSNTARFDELFEGVLS
jgi:hypothetical protein